jgi:hypothetical protein
MKVTDAAAVNKDQQQMARLVADWTKKSNALIAIPLFKDGLLDREAIDALRQDEWEARQRVADFLDSG